DEHCRSAFLHALVTLVDQDDVTVDHSPVPFRGAAAPRDRHFGAQHVTDLDRDEVAPIGVQQPHHRLTAVQVVQQPVEHRDPERVLQHRPPGAGFPRTTGAGERTGPLTGDPGERFEVLFGDHARTAAEPLAHGEVLEELGRHDTFPSSSSEMTRSWISEVPSKVRVSRSSLQCRSTAKSVVQPAPPWICTASLVTRSAISLATYMAMAASIEQRRPLSISVAAWYISWRAASISAAMRAILNRLYWNSPIGRPNCSR